jgi:hypothetical protein
LPDEYRSRHGIRPRTPTGPPPTSPLLRALPVRAYWPGNLSIPTTISTPERRYITNVTPDNARITALSSVRFKGAVSPPEVLAMETLASRKHAALCASPLP